MSERGYARSARTSPLSFRKFQARIYYNQGHIDYAYQLVTDLPLLLWDDKEEFPRIETYPHHHHDEQGNVKPSPLTGDPVRDIEIVLHDVSKFLLPN